MSVKLLAFAATAASSTLTCSHGSCADSAVHESSVLLQRRKGRAVPLKLAEQAASEKRSDSEDLVAAAKAMLREGTTNDELDFANYTMQELVGTVLPALVDGHEHDQELLDEMMKHFGQAAETFAHRRTEIEQLEAAEAVLSTKHLDCRTALGPQCTTAVTCETERTRLWRAYKEIESEYLATVHLIHNQWCELDENRSSASWVETQERRFESYYALGEERITRLEEHDEEKTRCQETNRSIAVAAEACDDLKQELEHTSCARLSAYNSAIDELDTNWRMASETFDQIVAAVTSRHQVRTQELKSLGSIKCLLKHIVDRSLQPCSEEDEPGEFVSIVDECDGYWQIDMTDFDWQSELEIPEPPAKPSADLQGLEPCSAEYLVTHYGERLADDCIHDLPDCVACSEHAHPSCGGGQVWNPCGSACERTCAEPHPTCTEQCVERCECPAARPLLRDGICIAEDQCLHTDVDEPAPPNMPADMHHDADERTADEPPPSDMHGDAGHANTDEQRRQAGCEGGQVWNDCGSECDRTCEEQHPACTQQCVARCECPEATPLLQEGVCITYTQCSHHDADENDFLKSAWNVSGKVLMLMAPVDNPKECADKCNDVDACVAFRYFEEPMRGCELLSEVDPNTGHYDEKTISYAKKVVQEIVFAEFADQPEFEKITFASVDQDSNHKLDESEFQAFYDLISSRILGDDLYNSMPQSDRTENAKGQFLHMDINSDGVIDRSEAKSTKYMVDSLVGALTMWRGMMGGLETGAQAKALMQLYSGEVSVDGEFGIPRFNAAVPRGAV